MKKTQILLPLILLALAAGAWFVPGLLDPAHSTTIVDPLPDNESPAEDVGPATGVTAPKGTGKDPKATEERGSERQVYTPKPTRSDLPQGVAGTVISSRGGALMDAEVYLMKDMDTATLIQRLSQMVNSGNKKLQADLVGEARTDANGRFRIGAEPMTGEVGYQLHIRAKNHIYLTKKVFVKKGEWEQLGLVKLQPGRSVQGRVLDKETGAPVAQATVKVLIPSISPIPFTLPGNDDGITVLANGAGYYKFEAVLPLDMPLSFEAWGKDHAKGGESDVVLTEKEFNRTLDIKLDRGYPISGRVTGPEDKGMPRVKMTAQPFSTQSATPAETWTDSDGYYSLPDLAAGQYTVEATKPGYGKDARTPVKAGDAQVNLRLEKQTGILVTVVDKRGKPVKSYRLEVKPWFEDATGGSYGRGMPAMDVRNPDGQKEIGGLEAGDWAVQITSPKYAKTYSDKFLVAEGSQEGLEVKVVMNDGGTIEGFVYNETGKPVAGATIETLDNSYQDNPLMVIFGRLMQVKNSQVTMATNSKGRFLLKKLTPGKYQLRIDHPNHSRKFIKDIQVIEGQKTVLPRIVIKQGCRVAGRVMYRGMPAVNAKVTITMQPENGEAPQHYVFDTVYSDTKGQYKSSRPLPAGKYELNAVKIDQANPLQGILQAQKSRKEVTLFPGAKANIVNLLIPD
jgi:protocatechuate 3,4-dioxygenase beta subunit